MKRQDYFNEINKVFRVIHIVKDTEAYKILRLRHRTLNKDIILRSYPTSIAAYEELFNISAVQLPEIYDVITLDDGMIVLEEYIDSVTVAQVMESNKYSYTAARKVLREVCSALAELHNRGLVHRDVKPENVLVTNEGRVVLIDFNAANKIATAKRDTVIMGTVGYASPEQLGISRSDSRTDVYALGVMLNVMLTGKHPSEKLAMGRAGKIIRKSTNINPDERYQTAEKFAKAL